MANFTNTIKEEEFRSATGDKKMILKTGKERKSTLDRKTKRQMDIQTSGQTDKLLLSASNKRVCVL